MIMFAISLSDFVVLIKKAENKYSFLAIDNFPLPGQTKTQLNVLCVTHVMSMLTTLRHLKISLSRRNEDNPRMSLISAK